MSIDYRFEPPVPYSEVLEAARRGLPGVCVCTNKFEPLEEAAVLYDGVNHVHFGVRRDGTNTWITRFAGNDAGRILRVLKERFGREILSEYDEGYDDGADDEDD